MPAAARPGVRALDARQGVRGLQVAAGPCDYYILTTYYL